jgi:hypothetical protein
MHKARNGVHFWRFPDDDASWLVPQKIRTVGVAFAKQVLAEQVIDYFQ